MKVNPDMAVSLAMQGLCAGIDAALETAAGERMGFCLLVFPFGRLGGSNYASNAKPENLRNLVLDILAKLDAGMPHIPLHERN